jgi:hypothetical protein
VLVLSQYIEVAAASDLLTSREAGIGYLLKERVSDVDEFVEVCRRVADGRSVIDPIVAAEPAVVVFQSRSSEHQRPPVLVSTPASVRLCDD